MGATVILFSVFKKAESEYRMSVFSSIFAMFWLCLPIYKWETDWLLLLEYVNKQPVILFS